MLLGKYYVNTVFAVADPESHGRFGVWKKKRFVSRSNFFLLCRCGPCRVRKKKTVARSRHKRARKKGEEAARRQTTVRDSIQTQIDFAVPLFHGGVFFRVVVQSQRSVP